MEQQQLVVNNPTGVALALPIAGPGGRSYAFVIDWHIRVLLVLAWYLLGLLLTQANFEANTLLLNIPAFLIYVLYHPIIEVVMAGSSPGKRMAGVRIVTDQGLPPGAGQLVVRNLFRMIDSLPLLYVIGLTACVVTKQSVRLGDLAAGTLLVYDKSEPKLEGIDDYAGDTKLTAKQIEIVQDLLDRWQTLTADRRNLLGHQLLEKLGERVPLSVSQTAALAMEPENDAKSRTLHQALTDMLAPTS